MNEWVSERFETAQVLLVKCNCDETADLDEFN